MPDYEVVWHGGMVSYVAAWSKTKGELSSPRAEAARPVGWVPPPLEEVDAFGLPRQPSMQTASQTATTSAGSTDRGQGRSSPEANVQRASGTADWILGEDGDWFLDPAAPPGFLD
jgi:hypothetical protein